MTFSMSLNQFIVHTVNMELQVREATDRALERAARIVEAEAKRELGTYQGTAGPFASWAQLSPYTKAERVRLGYTPNDPGLRSGDMRDSVEHKVEMRFNIPEGVAQVGSNEPKAVDFELGTTTQPPRSFLGRAAARKSQKVRDICGEAVVVALIGGGKL